MPRIPSRATTLLLLTPATVALAGAAANGDIFQWMNDPDTYGHLCQYSIPNELAEESCAPASATNVLQHLQNTYASSLGGIQLVGEGYDGWISTAQTLAHHRPHHQPLKFHSDVPHHKEKNSVS